MSAELPISRPVALYRERAGEGVRGSGNRCSGLVVVRVVAVPRLDALAQGEEGDAEGC
jgi:hypothetical protein